MIPSRLLILVMAFLFCDPVFARKFSFESEDMAAYFRGTGGLSSVGQDAFSKNKGSGTSLSSEKPSLNYSGELGFLFKIHDNVNLRAGAEILQARVSQLKGTNASGQELYELESDIFAFNPIATLEFNWSAGEKSRFVGYLGFGLANVRLDNKYVMTAQGVSDLNQDTYTEKSEGSFINGVVGLGWEGLFVDNVTALLDVGFRFLDVNKLKHSADNPNLDGSGGTSSKGSELTNIDDGSPRVFDLGGPFIGLSFRFYIDII